MPRILIFLLLVFLPLHLHAADQSPKGDPTTVVAGLSDTEARQMLLAELEKENAPVVETKHTHGPARILNGLLTNLDESARVFENRFAKIYHSLPLIFPSFIESFKRLDSVGTSRGALYNIGWIIAFITFGLIIEKLVNSYIIRHYFQENEDENIPTNVAGKLFAGIINKAPNFLCIFIFFLASYLANIFVLGTDFPFIQIFFFATLIGIILSKITLLVSEIIFAPKTPQFRPFDITTVTAERFHKAFSFFLIYIIITSLVGVILHRLGGSYNSYVFIVFTAATVLISLSILAVLRYRHPVRNYISTETNGQPVSWGKRHFANIWHLITIFYLFAVWILTVNTLGDHNQNSGLAFTLSFFAPPLWFVLDKMTVWILEYGVNLFASTQVEAEEKKGEEEELLSTTPEPPSKIIFYGRISVAVAILSWFCSLWGVNIPLVSKYFDAIFDSLLVCAIALIFWKFLCDWTQKKIDESLPEEEETEEEEDHDGWGAGGASKSRAYTLLPMLRKFIGTTLLVMVVMTILSQLGVNIGPLLAGAGVIGLAIGFGAQKLVADVFSGFFYLLDDAFRVGEYLTTSSISGTVESISLRNVFIRHHLGMLQIVPHSELGAITNFMRGGIVVKFNLDFPYDADIDKIRKIIKKVGIAMLDDEELKNDFIQPVKSQGVREIANSVMTIRVKFTAQPGRHFLIRREAYKRVTEALNQKGIYYAHRKVIVDIPEKADEATKDEVVSAAGAAAAASLTPQKPQTPPASSVIP